MTDKNPWHIKCKTEQNYSQLKNLKMKLNNYEQIQNLQVGDKLVREKGIFSKHHGVVAGRLNGRIVVAENQRNVGVQYIWLDDFLLNDLNNLTRVEQFNGTEWERNQVAARIKGLIGTPYNLLSFNCEHFVEAVLNQKPKSKQINNVFIAVALIFVSVAFIFNPKKTKIQ